MHTILPIAKLANRMKIAYLENDIMNFPHLLPDVPGQTYKSIILKSLLHLTNKKYQKRNCNISTYSHFQPYVQSMKDSIDNGKESENFKEKKNKNKKKIPARK